MIQTSPPPLLCPNIGCHTMPYRSRDRTSFIYEASSARVTAMIPGFRDSRSGTRRNGHQRLRHQRHRDPGVRFGSSYGTYATAVRPNASCHHRCAFGAGTSERCVWRMGKHLRSSRINRAKTTRGQHHTSASLHPHCFPARTTVAPVTRQFCRAQPSRWCLSPDVDPRRVLSGIAGPASALPFVSRIDRP
jgi:hypothetical protein